MSTLDEDQTAQVGRLLDQYSVLLDKAAADVERYRALLRTIRGWHKPIIPGGVRQLGVVCDPCRVQWPCDTERLIAETFGEIPRGTPGNLLQPGEIEGWEA